jgi:hypothetical protein
MIFDVKKISFAVNVPLVGVNLEVLHLDLLNNVITKNDNIKKGTFNNNKVQSQFYIILVHLRLTDKQLHVVGL